MDEIAIASYADDLIKNPAFNKAISGFRASLVKQLEEIPLVEKDLQHEIVITLQVLANIERQLKSFIVSGDIERKRADEAQKWNERRRSSTGSY